MRGLQALPGPMGRGGWRRGHPKDISRRGHPKIHPPTSLLPMQAWGSLTEPTLLRGEQGGGGEVTLVTPGGGGRASGWPREPFASWPFSSASMARWVPAIARGSSSQYVEGVFAENVRNQFNLAPCANHGTPLNTLDPLNLDNLNPLKMYHICKGKGALTPK